MKSRKDDPFVKSLHFITKDYFGALSLMMEKTEIDRNYYTLLLICRSDNGLTQKELSALIDVDKVTMSRKIDHLHGLGLVKREANVNDRRTIRIVPTTAAIELATVISEAYLHLNKASFKGISAAERDQFLATAEKVRQNVQKLPKTGVKMEYKQKSMKP